MLRNGLRLRQFKLVAIADKNPEVERMIFALNDKNRLILSYLSKLSHKDIPVKFELISNYPSDKKVDFIIPHEKLLQAEIDNTPEKSKTFWSKQINLNDVQDILDNNGDCFLEMEEYNVTQDELDYIHGGYSYELRPHVVEEKYIIHKNNVHK